jgi:hypothetical protein
VGLGLDTGQGVGVAGSLLLYQAQKISDGVRCIMALHVGFLLVRLPV